MQAMIFAAGLGTRLKPLTDTMPKALVEVGGKPLLEHVTLKLKDAGFSHVVVNVHHFAKQIIDYLGENKNFDIDIQISNEMEQLLNTGGGIKRAAHLFSPHLPILIHNVDILSNVDLRNLYLQATDAYKLKDAEATLLVSQRITQRYLIFNKDMRLMGWTNVMTGEVKSPFPIIQGLRFSQPQSDQATYCQHDLFLYAFSGIHILCPPAIKRIEKVEEDIFPIMEFYLQNCDKMTILGVINNDLKLLDVGKLNSLHAAEEFLVNNGFLKR